MAQQSFLADRDFSHVVRHAPLVSIDVVVRDPEGNVLLGLRANEPARGTFFVPGGIVRKNESVEAAFARILAVEIGCNTSLAEANFLGVFQHFYNANRFGDPGYGTHYVVLGYELKLGLRPDIVSDSQHKEFRWMTEAEIVSSARVHPNTKAYFRLPRPSDSDIQY